MTKKAQTNGAGCFRSIVDVFQIIGAVAGVFSVLIAIVALIYAARNPERIVEIGENSIRSHTFTKGYHSYATRTTYPHGYTNANRNTHGHSYPPANADSHGHTYSNHYTFTDQYIHAYSDANSPP